MARVKATIEVILDSMPTERECTEDSTSLFEVVEDELRRYVIRDYLINQEFGINVVKVERISN